jgi:hypothetical protein
MELTKMCPLNLENEPYINVTNSKNETTQCLDLSSQKWEKSLIFKGIFGKATFYEPLKERPTQLRSYSSWVYRTYKVKAGVCPICKEALEREQIKESFCRIRKMSIRSGLYRRCFIGALKGQDFTDWFMNWDSANWKLLEEKPVSEQEVFELFKSNSLDFICDFGLCATISEKLGYDLN